MDRETSKENELRDTLIVVDHFGLISGGSKNTVERETEHSRQLRTKIKKKRHAALLDLMQFRKARNLEESNSAPTGNDVKGSGAIYEDAFACLILHREINKDTRKMSNAVSLDLCKLRRGGSTGSTTGEFDTRRLSFVAEPENDYEDRYDMEHD
jgi:replicative DNA helicase